MWKGDLFQCQQCGHIHRVRIRFDIENDVYVTLECPRCRGSTEHLWCGRDEIEIYTMYNVNVDPRYYDYTIK